MESNLSQEPSIESRPSVANIFDRIMDENPETKDNTECKQEEKINFSDFNDQIIHKPRSLEEEHTIILQRNKSASSKCSNSRYECRYCGFQFVGGPQKIRVHITGKKENGSRLAKCEKAPTQVRKLLEARMLPRKSSFRAVGLGEVSLPRRPNPEENHCVVLKRSENPKCKNSNSTYRCSYCSHKFIGGPQKIRVHLTGIQEGGTKVAKCTKVPPEVSFQLQKRRRQGSEGSSGSIEIPMVTEDYEQVDNYQSMSSLNVPISNNMQMEDGDILTTEFIVQKLMEATNPLDLSLPT